MSCFPQIFPFLFVQILEVIFKMLALIRPSANEYKFTYYFLIYPYVIQTWKGN